MTTENREAKFSNWMTRVDTYLEETLGVTTSELPDIDYWSMFDSQISARETATWVFVKSRDDHQTWIDYGYMDRA